MSEVHRPVFVDTKNSLQMTQHVIRNINKLSTDNLQTCKWNTIPYRSETPVFQLILYQGKRV